MSEKLMLRPCGECGGDVEFSCHDESGEDAVTCLQCGTGVIYDNEMTPDEVAADWNAADGEVSESSEMRAEKYKAIQLWLLGVARLVLDLDLEGFLKRMDKEAFRNFPASNPDFLNAEGPDPARLRRLALAGVRFQQMAAALFDADNNATE